MEGIHWQREQVVGALDAQLMKAEGYAGRCGDAVELMGDVATLLHNAGADPQKARPSFMN